MFAKGCGQIRQEIKRGFHKYQTQPIKRPPVTNQDFDQQNKSAIVLNFGKFRA